MVKRTLTDKNLVNNEQFEHYISEAILALPERLRKRIENVAFVVEDDERPSKNNERLIKSQGVLLGLYQGVPLTRRSQGYSLVLPDKITIFKRPIEMLGGNNEERTRQIIHEVVHHEIGHYFGMDEQRVRAWEKKKRRSLR